MKKIYVASPLRGDIPGNLKRAAKYCSQVQYDGIPICPHLYFSTFLQDKYTLDRAQGISMGKALLEECDAVYVFCDEVSEGIIGEIKLAREKKIPIKFFDADGNRIEPDALLINNRIGPALRKIIEEYDRQRTIHTCPYAGNCKKKQETKKRSPKFRGMDRWRI